VRQSGGIDCVSLNLSHSGRIDHKIIATIHPSVVARECEDRTAFIPLKVDTFGAC